MTGAVAVVELAVATAPPSNETINIYILGLNDLIFLLNFIFWEEQIGITSSSFAICWTARSQGPARFFYDRSTWTGWDEFRSRAARLALSDYVTPATSGGHRFPLNSENQQNL